MTEPYRSFGPLLTQEEADLRYPAGDPTNPTDGYVWTYDVASGGWLARPANAHSHEVATQDAAGFQSAANFAKTQRVPDAETSQRVVYVSPTGSDSAGDGTSANRWATIQHAVNQARAMMQQTNATSAYKIVCATGTYDAPVVTPPLLFAAHSAGGAGGTWIESETGVASDVLITAGANAALSAITAYGSCTIRNVTLENDTRAMYVLGGPSVMAYVRGCVLRRRTVANGGRAAMECSFGSAISYDNSSVTGQLFDYGLMANYNGTIGRLGGQPTGAVANTLANSGGRIG